MRLQRDDEPDAYSLIVPLIEIDPIDPRVEEEIEKAMILAFVTCELCEAEPARRRTFLPELSSDNKCIVVVYSCMSCNSHVLDLHRADRVALARRIILKLREDELHSRVGSIDDSALVYARCFSVLWGGK